MNLLKGCYQDKAKVVDGKLILSLPNALTPVVWQMDLTQAKTSSLEINDNKKDGFALVMKTPKGETIQIAPFEKKEQALRSLMAASKALNSAHGQINVQTTQAAGANTQTYIVNQKSKFGFVKKAALVLGGIFIIMVMLGYIMNSNPRAPSSLSPSGFDDTTAQQQPAAADTTGVPVSADEYLKRR